ncbi:MAG: SRPBCC domain-containing protein [Ignavibacteria bacterium]|nr:SRPBCC domain-containing protein [Ignavibacteria bacterium]
MESNKEVNIARIFDAPRELVFKAWSSSAHLSNWYFPGTCSITIYKLEFKPGGVFQHSINSPDGTPCKCKGEYIDIVENEKISYKLGFCDDDGNFISSAQTDKHSWPDETTVTVTFEDYEGKTKLTLHQTVSEELAKQTGAYPSWLEMLDKLEKEVKKSEAVK